MLSLSRTQSKDKRKDKKMEIEYKISEDGQATRLEIYPDHINDCVVGEVEGETLTMMSNMGRFVLPLRKFLKHKGIVITKCINPDPIPARVKKKVKEMIKESIESKYPESIDNGLQDLNPASLPEFYENKPALTPYEKRQRSRLIDKHRSNGLPMTKAEKVAYESLQMGFWPYDQVSIPRNRPIMGSTAMVFKMDHQIAALIVGQDDPYPSKETCPPGDISWQYGNKNPKAADWVLRNLGQEEWDLLYTGVVFPIVDGSFKMGFDPNEADEMKKAGIKEIYLPPIG